MQWTQWPAFLPNTFSVCFRDAVAVFGFVTLVAAVGPLSPFSQPPEVGQIREKQKQTKCYCTTKDSSNVFICCLVVCLFFVVAAAFHFP